VEIAPVGVLESDTFLNKEENAEQALIGLYDLMQYNYAKDWSSAYFLKVPGDEANAGGGSSTDQPQLQDIDDYTNVSVSNASILSVWNYIIEQLRWLIQSLRLREGISNQQTICFS
jgi:hypothetical protein